MEKMAQGGKKMPGEFADAWDSWDEMERYKLDMLGSLGNPGECDRGQFQPSIFQASGCGMSLAFHPHRSPHFPFPICGPSPVSLPPRCGPAHGSYP